MPRAKNPPTGELLDTWGRKNRKLENRTCPICERAFRPLRKTSKFCSRPCMYIGRKRRPRKQKSWWVNPKGYIEGRVLLPDGTQKAVKQHRHIMERVIGRALEPSEDVHHIDGNRSNNALDNLKLMSRGEHTRISNLNRKYRKGYKMNLSDEERLARSRRAIVQGLSEIGQAAIAKARGNE